jgi:hypothetical protein
MSKQQIINFRVKDNELEAIDRRATAEGLSRSDFIRSAINLALQAPSMSLSEREVHVDIKPKQSGPQCVNGQVRGCQTAIWVRTANRQKQCQVCGVTTS